ncbi:MAG: glutamine amidotransferase [Gammaproteobacteria bacterium]|jgi:GMP synthase (glutamine-hydrolysing)|nr:glutamine amidotransferase [Gammaproteobacteria bacterium]MBT4494867.1 glutamine amidotransferase [Gammaproteobacteria bacterium]
MTKPFLVIQLRPEDETADSEFAAIRRYGGIQENEVVRHRAELGGLPEIDLETLSAIIVGGSPFDVSTPAIEKSPIQKKIESDFSSLFKEIEERDFPFLGACSGNGLLGSYCGATISTRYGEPVGGADITLTGDGREDPLLKGLPDTFRVLLGHKEACDDVPPGTVLLAGSENCPVQMFRLKNNIYATQFHPEADRYEFEVRINVYRDHGYFPSTAAEELKMSIAREEVPESHEILRRFVDRYRSHL